MLRESRALSAPEYIRKYSGLSSDGEYGPGEYVIESVAKRATWQSTSINLVNTAVGAGVLSFPYAFSRTGLSLGIALSMSLSLLFFYTLRILVQIAERYDCHTYLQLTRTIGGMKFARFVSVAIVLDLYGACVAYFIIIGDNVTPLVTRYVSDADWLGDRRVIISIIAILVMLPLALVRNLQSLAASSAVAVVAIAYVGVMVIVKGATEAKPDPPWQPILSSQTTLALPIVCFAYQVHIQGISLFSELRRGTEDSKEEVPEDPALSLLHRRGPSRIAEMFRAAAVALAFCCALYTLVGIFGLLYGGSHVESDILEAFRHDDVPSNIARLAIATVAALSFPVNSHPARAVILELLGYVPPYDTPLVVYVGVTLIYFFVALVPALLLESLGIVFDIAGALAAAPLTISIPGYLILTDPRCTNHSRAEGWILLLVGIVLTIVSVSVTIAR